MGLLVLVMLLSKMAQAGATSQGIDLTPRSAPRDGEPTVYSDLPRTRDSANDGLTGLYDIMRSFLGNGVMPKTIGDLIDEYEIRSFSDFQEDDFLNDWQSWIFYLIGFIICIVVGLLFCILMPLCGCCALCCGCCKKCFGLCCKCCRRKPGVEGKRDKCKSIVCGSLLFVTTAMLLAGVAIVYATNDSLRVELSDEGVLTDWADSIYKTGEYLNDTVKDVDDYLLRPLYLTTDKTVDKLQDIPEDSFITIDEALGISTLLVDLNTFAFNLIPLEGNLTLVKDNTENLDMASTDLSAQLQASAGRIETALVGCSTSDCDTALDLLPQLDIDATYGHLDDVTAVLAAVTSALDNDIIDATSQSLAIYRSLQKQIENDTSEVIEDVVASLEEFNVMLSDGYDELSDNIYAVDMTDAFDWLDELQKEIDVIAGYYTSSVIVVTTVFLIIPILILLGLLVGVFCPKPRKSSSRCCSCTTHQSANLMKAGLVLTFLFTWLFMLVTTLHFAVGGLAETLVCRHLRDYDDTMVKLEKLLMVEWKAGGMTFNVSIQQVMEECKADSSLYKAMNLEANGKNITEMLDLEQYGIYDAMDDLADLQFDFSDVEFYSAELNDALLYLDEQLKLVDYEPYKVELEKDVTQIDLLAYADLLDDIARDPTYSALEVEADILRGLYDTHVTPMEDARDILEDSVAWSYYYTEVIPLSDLTGDLTLSQERLQTEGGDLVEDMIGDYVDDLIQILEDYCHLADYNVREEIGRCRPMYDAGNLCVTSLCQYFLEAFNGLWFCYGWALFFIIPAMFFSSGLITYYRKSKKHSTVEHQDDRIEITPIPANRAGVTEMPTADDSGVVQATNEPMVGNNSVVFKDEKPGHNEDEDIKIEITPTPDKQEELADTPTGDDNDNGPIVGKAYEGHQDEEVTNPLPVQNEPQDEKITPRPVHNEHQDVKIEITPDNQDVVAETPTVDNNGVVTATNIGATPTSDKQEVVADNSDVLPVINKTTIANNFVVLEDGKVTKPLPGQNEDQGEKIEVTPTADKKETVVDTPTVDDNGVVTATNELALGNDNEGGQNEEVTKPLPSQNEHQDEEKTPDKLAVVAETPTADNNGVVPANNEPIMGDMNEGQQEGEVSKPLPVQNKGETKKKKEEN